MPNWCYNKLKIFGDTKVRKRVAKFVKSTNEIFSLEKIKSVLQEYASKSLEECDERICNINYKFYKNMSVYTFYTAWGPPWQLIKELSGQFPDLYFLLEFNEPMMLVKGKMHFKNGEIIKDY